jgi:hypothetical protein
LTADNCGRAGEVLPQFIFSFENYNFYLNWLNLANHFGGTSSTNSKVPFICYQKAMELSGNNVHACYKVVFDFYNNTKDYDKKYGIVLKRWSKCAKKKKLIFF